MGDMLFILIYCCNSLQGMQKAGNIYNCCWTQKSLIFWPHNGLLRSVTLSMLKVTFATSA